MLSTLRHIPVGDVEPGDLVHHPDLPGPARVWWPLPGQDAAARPVGAAGELGEARAGGPDEVVLLLAPDRDGVQARMLALPVWALVSVVDARGDDPAARLLAAARGAHWLTRHPHQQPASTRSTARVTPSGTSTDPDPGAAAGAVIDAGHVHVLLASLSLHVPLAMVELMALLTSRLHEPTPWPGGSAATGPDPLEADPTRPGEPSMLASDGPPGPLLPTRQRADDRPGGVAVVLPFRRPERS